MPRFALWIALSAVTGAAPLLAQKPPPTVRRPQAQPQAQQPAASSPKTAGKTFRPTTTATQPATQARGGGAQAPTPAVQPTAPAGQGAAQVTPQAAHPVTPAATAFTAGLAMTPYGGGAADAALDYAVRFGRMLDSTIVTLVDVFRNTSGQPMEGARAPTALSQRERDRWSRCRNLYWDLTTYASAVGTMRRSLPADPALQQAAAALDSAFTANQALEECDNVASMVAAPDRWTPWQDQYQTAAQHFYRDFYNQVREVHERDRAFVNALNAVLPAARRIPVPPGLQRNPPYAGAAPG